MPLAAERNRLALHEARLDELNAARDQILEMLKHQKSLKSRRPEDFSADQRAIEATLGRVRVLALNPEYEVSASPGPSASAPTSEESRSLASSASASFAQRADMPRFTTGIALGVPLVILVLIGGLGFLAQRGRIVLDDTPKFVAAMERFSGLLLAGPETAPREVRRFQNRTRYLALRARLRKYLQGQARWLEQLSGSKDVWSGLQDLEVGDSELVLASALFAVRPPGLSTQELAQWLSAPLKYADEAGIAVAERLKLAIETALEGRHVDKVPQNDDVAVGDPLPAQAAEPFLQIAHILMEVEAAVLPRRASL